MRVKRSELTGVKVEDLVEFYIGSRGVSSRGGVGGVPIQVGGRIDDGHADQAGEGRGCGEHAEAGDGVGGVGDRSQAGRVSRGARRGRWSGRGRAEKVAPWETL